MKGLVQDSGASVIVPLHDVPALERALRELYHQYEKKKLKQVSAEFAEQFSRVSLTGELARQFESLMDIDKHGLVKLNERAA